MYKVIRNVWNFIQYRMILTCSYEKKKNEINNLCENFFDVIKEKCFWLTNNLKILHVLTISVAIRIVFQLSLTWKQKLTLIRKNILAKYAIRNSGKARRKQGKGLWHVINLQTRFLVLTTERAGKITRNAQTSEQTKISAKCSNVQIIHESINSHAVAPLTNAKP